LVPAVITLLSATISIWVFTILVGMFRDWKKDVYLGSKPVGPALIQTSSGAMIPTLAGASLV